MTTGSLSKTADLHPYAHLADFYEKAGFARFGVELIPHIIQFAQQNGWLGRRILDLGCGVGVVAVWLSQQGFRVTGVDISNPMLVKARHNAQKAGVAISWRQQDIRALEYSEGTQDMIVSLGVLNHMRNPGELESIFKHVYSALAPERLFVFDLHTLRGLAERWGTGDRLAFDNRRDLTLMIRSNFSYETLGNTLQFIIFHREHEKAHWRRAEETHTLQAYPIHIVTSLLRRTGFETRVMNTRFQPFDFTEDEGRTLFFAHKPAGG